MKNKKIVLPILAILFAIASAFTTQRVSSKPPTVYYESSPANCKPSACGQFTGAQCSNTFLDITCLQPTTLRKPS